MGTELLENLTAKDKLMLRAALGTHSRELKKAIKAAENVEQVVEAAQMQAVLDYCAGPLMEKLRKSIVADTAPEHPLAGTPMGEALNPEYEIVEDGDGAPLPPADPEHVTNLLVLILDLDGIRALYPDCEGDLSCCHEDLQLEIAEWTQEEREAAAHYAAAVHLAASDNDDVEIPAQPEKVAELERRIIAAKGHHLPAGEPVS